MGRINYQRIPIHNEDNVWEIVPNPEGKSVVSSKCIYKIKHRADGIIEKYKAIFVACGFSLKEGIDYEIFFSPIARYTSIRTSWHLYPRQNGS